MPFGALASNHHCARPRAVDGGEQAVLFDRLRGVLPETRDEGTHFLVPWLQKAIIFDVRTRPRSISSVTGTKGAHPRRSPGVVDSLRERAAPSLPERLLFGGTAPRSAHRRCADLQQVNLTLRLLSRPDSAKLPKIYQARAHPARRARPIALLLSGDGRTLFLDPAAATGRGLRRARASLHLQRGP